MTCENAYLKKNKYYCGMRGKWELSEHSKRCPKRKDGKDE